MRFTFVSRSKTVSVFVSVVQLFRDTFYGCIAPHVGTEGCANECQLVRGIIRLIAGRHIAISDSTVMGNLIDIPTGNAYTDGEYGSAKTFSPEALFSSHFSSGVEILLITFCVHFCLSYALTSHVSMRRLLYTQVRHEQYCFCMKEVFYNMRRGRRKNHG
ncbi:MAG: hypothetical protein AB8U44_03645 [Aaplasma endosymbiont of Hyalomma asiaticum]